MAKISQLKLDRQDYGNELVIVPLQLYKEGGLDRIYEGYNGRYMRKPREYFRQQCEHDPAKRFPLAKANILVNSFNSQLKQRNFTEESFGRHIAAGYALSELEMSKDVKMLFGVM